LIIQSVFFACRCALTNAWWSHAHAISNTVNWLARDRHWNHVVPRYFSAFSRVFPPRKSILNPK
jgi:hypothetical protein